MKYIALTIGPITKTIKKAQSTRGLWGASYIFSYLMKSIITQLKDTHKFVIPLTTDSSIFEPQNGAGLFPDRFIFESNDIEKDIAGLEKIIKQVLEKFSKDVEESIGRQMTIEVKDKKLSQIPHFDHQTIFDFLCQYLLIVAIEKEISTGNIIDECNRVLSIQELQQPIQAPEEIDFWYYILQGINKSFLPTEAFGGASTRFPSIAEISTIQLLLNEPEEYRKIVVQSLQDERNKDPEEIEDDDLITKLKASDKLGKHFRRRHKYIAIVKADGDNLGKTVEQIYLKAPQKINEVDKLLLEFNIETIRKIDLFGGKSVYLGGDDLLFFAPISYDDNETIFSRVEKISADYNKKFTDFFKSFETNDPNFWNYTDDSTQRVKKIQPPTLSFGISISYYKYPMFEALETADKLLEMAKKGKKNAAAFRVMKHSGQFFEATVSKNSNTYKDFFIPLLESSLDDDSFLSSVQFQLNRTSNVLEAALESDNYKTLKNYFDNFFNEPVHSTKDDFLKKVSSFLWQTYQDTKDPKKTLETVYSTLRTFQFLNQKDTSDE